MWVICEHHSHPPVWPAGRSATFEHRPAACSSYGSLLLLWLGHVSLFVSGQNDFSFQKIPECSDVHVSVFWTHGAGGSQRGSGSRLPLDFSSSLQFAFFNFFASCTRRLGRRRRYAAAPIHDTAQNSHARDDPGRDPQWAGCSLRAEGRERMRYWDAGGAEQRARHPCVYVGSAVVADGGRMSW